MTDDQPCPLKLNCSEMGQESNGCCQNISACIDFADRLASGTEDHQLNKQDGRWQCTQCGYNWRSKPQSVCPRAQQYGPNRPYPGVAATKSELQKMGLTATRLRVGVAYSRAGKAFYDLYDLKLVMPRMTASKLRIFRIYRLWSGELVGVERTWKGMPEGAGWLECFYTREEALAELALLRARPSSPSEEAWELQHVPGLPDEIYALES